MEADGHMSIYDFEDWYPEYQDEDELYDDDDIDMYDDDDEEDRSVGWIS